MNAPKIAAPAPTATPPAGQELSRIVHTPAGVRRSRFEMHPSHKAVARTIDELNRDQAPAVQAAASGTPGITREQVLIAMGGLPAGATAVEICQALLGRNDERAVHRISAHLAREVRRGLVEPNETGRGAKRRLTPRGCNVAAQLEIDAATAKQQAHAAATVAARNAARPVNGVFDYARKMQLACDIE